MFNVYVWAEYDRGDVKLYTLNFTLWEKSFCLDTGIECLLTVSRPIGAVKFEEGGSVGNGERCLDELADSGVIIGIRCYTRPDKFFDVKWRLLEEVKEVYDNNRIEIPYPQLVVHSEK